MAEQVQDEDMGVCEEVQRNLNSRSYTTGRFSVKRENGGLLLPPVALGRASCSRCVGYAVKRIIASRKRSTCTRIPAVRGGSFDPVSSSA